MDGENASRPATWSVVGSVVADPPLIGFDRDDIQDFLAACGHDIQWRHCSMRELVVPSDLNCR